MWRLWRPRNGQSDYSTWRSKRKSPALVRDHRWVPGILQLGPALPTKTIPDASRDSINPAEIVYSWIGQPLHRSQH